MRPCIQALVEIFNMNLDDGARELLEKMALWDDADFAAHQEKLAAEAALRAPGRFRKEGRVWCRDEWRDHGRVTVRYDDIPPGATPWNDPLFTAGYLGQ